MSLAWGVIIGSGTLAVLTLWFTVWIEGVRQKAIEERQEQYTVIKAKAVAAK